MNSIHSYIHNGHVDYVSLYLDFIIAFKSVPTTVRKKNKYGQNKICRFYFLYNFFTDLYTIHRPNRTHEDRKV